MARASSDDTKTPGRVTFRYVKSPDYRIVAANGAAGGLTPQGDLLVSFFVESAAVPDEVTHHVDADGRLGAEEQSAPRQVPQVERRLQVGVLLSPSQAAALADWVRARLAEVNSGVREDT